MKRVSAFLLAAGFCGLGLAASAQAPETVTSAEIYLRLNKLNVLGTVLYMAAHPDDENSRLIAYMAKDRLYRTAYLSMTRGDGGQNLIGDEQGVELGLIRTQEMLAARRVDGAEQFFSRAFDFGFTKSTEEALKTWDKEKVLSDAVWVIRRFQPDVIITRFPPDSRAGHGHHSASAVIAQEAFVAAADPSRFPEQLKYGVKPWQARRIFWNTFNFGGANTTSEDQLKIDVGGFNPILGKSYGELAAISRTNHKSQGAALTPARGQSMEYFKLVAGDGAHSDPMEGVETTWRRVEGGEKIERMVNQLIRDFSLAHPEKSVAGLAAVYKAIGDLKDGYWKTQKLKEVAALITDCSGLWLEAVTRSPYAVQGDSLPVQIVLNNRLDAPIALREVTLDRFDTVLQMNLDGDKNYSFTRNLYVSLDKPLTQPYWLMEDMSPGSFNVKDQRLIGDPVGAPAYSVSFRLEVSGQEMVLTRPVQYKYTDAVKGELYEPLTVLPPATARFNPDLVLFTDGEQKGFRVEAMDRTGHAGLPKMVLTPTPGLTIGSSAGLAWTAKPSPSDATGTVISSLLFERNGRQDTALQLRTIAYDHIPRIDYFKMVREKFVLADVRIAGHRIGYIEGAGDKVPEALQEMGYEVVLLNEKDCTPAFLKQFDAVIAGVRAYDVHDWLSARHEVLMQYVNEGGNLIVQYNRGNLGRMTTAIGPYNFAIANIRVTDEHAPVHFLLPDHAVLNYPNKISSTDFEGWIQERGIYFAGQTDPAYQEVLSMSDPGEQEQKGSLIVAHYGKGTFVYTGLVFFRELPAGVPGAYRLMANIIALNQKKGF
ncbi:PIG-L family deacetylase [Puia dinghuensis]|uniref:GlcNAc-PI de-N-acetylase n=1 Tax=Puia dinghuensis TaxID=1792502 RepID=A0A8J2XRL6_9BACT|nr:PIG-L family deacetylase [Puia dinghuensis]GGA89484.1 GlcNAc-PI de-N-acetylase [Puia dinghuensis]